MFQRKPKHLIPYVRVLAVNLFFNVLIFIKACIETSFIHSFSFVPLGIGKTPIHLVLAQSHIFIYGLSPMCCSFLSTALPYYMWVCAHSLHVKMKQAVADEPQMPPDFCEAAVVAVCPAPAPSPAHGYAPPAGFVPPPGYGFAPPSGFAPPPLGFGYAPVAAPMAAPMGVPAGPAFAPPPSYEAAMAAAPPPEAKSSGPTMV